ncbi:hypothetical protein [Streptosporangium sp. NPDC051022]|uniref:hypothetical protein n=1 Tax=Streptosporangium sp. NPDC051022 TaxID=3155752 RepID=UPI0034167BE4
MKREHESARALAIHEAGHLLVGWAQTVVSVSASVWSPKGFTFTEVGADADWTAAEEKTRSIAAQVAVAVAGGAAELAVAGEPGVSRLAEIPLDDILGATGGIDFQLAQEWLALQRHDPSQDSIELEIVDVFRLVAVDLSASRVTSALGALADLFLSRRAARPREEVSIRLDEPEVRDIVAGLTLRADYPLGRTTTPNITEVTTR